MNFINFKFCIPTVVIAYSLVISSQGQQILSMNLHDEQEEVPEYIYDEELDEYIELSTTTNSINVVTIEFAADQEKQYLVESSSSLCSNDWEVAWDRNTGAEKFATDAFSAKASFGSAARTCFFRVRETDGIGPSFTFVNPSRNAIGVATNATIEIRIEDASGIDADSLGIRIDDARVESELLTWNDPILTYTPSDDFLGTNGQHLSISAYAKDCAGNFLESERSDIVLEAPLVVKESIISFSTFSDMLPSSGSKAKGAFANITTKASSSETPELLEINNGSLLFASTNGISVGQLTCGVTNLIPWYRKIITVTTNGDGTATAITEDASPMDFFESGTFDSDNESNWVLYEKNEAGEYELIDYGGMETQAASFVEKRGITTKAEASPKTKTISISGSWSPSLPNPFSVRNFLSYSFNTTAKLAFEKDSDTFDFYLQNSDFSVSFHPTLSLSTSGNRTYSGKVLSKSWLWGFFAGPVPICATLELDVDSVAALSGAVAGSVTTGTKLHSAPYLHMHVSGLWGNMESAGWSWSSSPFTTSWNLNGAASIRLDVPCKLGFYAYGLIGAYAQCGPYVTLNASGNSASQSLSRKAVAGVDGEFALDLKGLDVPWVCDKTTWTFNLKKWTLFDDEVSVAPPTFTSFPSDLTVQCGASVSLQPEVAGAKPISYKWYKDGQDLRKTGKDLAFTMTTSTPGTYKLVATNPYGSASRQVVVAMKDNISDWIGTWRLDFRYEWKEFVEENSWICPDGYFIKAPLQIESWHREIHLFEDKTAKVFYVDDSYEKAYPSKCPYGCCSFAFSFPTERTTKTGTWEKLANGNVVLRCKYDNYDGKSSHRLQQKNKTTVFDEGNWEFTKTSARP